jgi:porin
MPRMDCRAYSRRLALAVIMFPILTFSGALSSRAFAEVKPFSASFKARQMPVTGGTLYVRVGGSGPAVLMLHGFGDTGDMWQPLADVLVKDHTVIVPDLRGMGLSSHQDGGYEKTSQARELVGILDELKVGPFALVTHDIGNMVGYAVAAQYRNRVTKWVAMDAPLPGLGTWNQMLLNPKLWHFNFRGPDVERLVAGRERILLDRFYNELSANPARIDEQTRRHYAALYARPRAIHDAFSGQFAAFSQDAEDNKALFAKVGKLPMPVLAIGGDRSFGASMKTELEFVASDVRGATIASSDEKPTGWLNQNTMTGDWGGTRTRLEDAGVNVRAHHTSESGQNPTGGQFAAARYAQQLDFGADLDLDRLAGVAGGQVLVTFTNRDGRSLSADSLGNNKFAVQEVFGYGQNFRFVELHYRQTLLDGKVVFDAGWVPIGGTFATSKVYCTYFQTLTTCGTVALNNPNWQHFPAGQWGAMARFQPRPEYYVASGVYQANPEHLTASNGFNLTFAATGAIVPIEFGWLPGQDTGGLPGEYKLGGYHDSSPVPDVFLDEDGHSAGLTGAPFAVHNGRWAVYFVATQMVYRETPGKDRGLTVFGLATTADKKTETFGGFYAGALYQGTFRHRDDDFISVLFAHGGYNSRLRRFQEDRNIVAPGSVGIQTHERVVEVDYGIAVAPWLQIRPNLQYVIRPSGTGQVPNAFVIGLLTRTTF